MTKADDSSLDPDQRRAVEKRARRLLDRADAWDRYPTPVDDILAAANLKVAKSGIFDPAKLAAFVKDKTSEATANVKSAVDKVFGLYDGAENLIHIDKSVVATKQTFLKLHETGHHEIPTHRKMFRFFQDCRKTLSPEIADQFEREANNFARFTLFQGDTYMKCAGDCADVIKTPMRLANDFGASIYASMREYARTHHKACIVYALEPIKTAEDGSIQAAVRRIEPSASFRKQFGAPKDKAITLDHALGPVLPIGRKMTKPTSLSITDKNGVEHECVAEAFNTTWNIFILLFPVRALTATTVIMPSTAN